MKTAKEKLNHFKTAVRSFKLIYYSGKSTYRYHVELCIGYLNYNIVFTYNCFYGLLFLYYDDTFVSYY